MTEGYFYNDRINASMKIPVKQLFINKLYEPIILNILNLFFETCLRFLTMGL